MGAAARANTWACTPVGESSHVGTLAVPVWSSARKFTNTLLRIGLRGDSKYDSASPAGTLRLRVLETTEPRSTNATDYAGAIAATACSSYSSPKSFSLWSETMTKPISTDQEGLIERVLTKEEQDQLTPAIVVGMLQEGNARFVAGEVTIRNHKAQIRQAVASQFPKAIVLSCVDSRVPVEDVFDRGIGDIFVARVAGNFVNPDILGSMEFACHVSGAKLILVMGHEHCGAVKSAIDDVRLGNITEMLSKVTPAVEQTAGFDGDRTSKNAAFVHAVTERNVRLTMQRIRDESEVLRKMEEDKSIAIAGAVYDMDNGAVVFLD